MNGDGNQDIITGHYWPGDIFIFFGKGDGKFAKMDNLKDETGRNLNAGEPWKDEQKPRMDSLAAAPFATDFDGDGDFDMLIGNIEGTIVLMENIGGATDPVFSTDRKKLEADGKEIRVAGGDAGPVFEDWNHDGVRDLVVGAGDGSVLFYKNIGRDDAPQFAAAETLVTGTGWEPFPHGSAPQRPGVRSKVCVADYNGDGLVDLLLGDFLFEKSAALDLSDEQIKRRDELRAKRTKLMKQLRALQPSKEKKAEAAKKRREDIITRYRTLQSALGQYEERNINHGFVWLYLRKPGAKTAAN